MFSKLLLVCLFTAVSVFAGGRGIGELPHGNVYLVNPEVDGKTTSVELKVDRSGFLKGKYIHVLFEKNYREKEIDVDMNTIVPVLPATVYYHAHNTYEKLIELEFQDLTETVKIVLSHSRVTPIRIKPEDNTIIFGKNGLEKHALDSDIISNAVISLLLMAKMEISSRDRLTSELEGLIYGISYFLNCLVSRTPMFTSFPLEQYEDKIGFFESRRSNDNISQKVAILLWDFRTDLGSFVANNLLYNVINTMRKHSTVEDFITNILWVDQSLYDGSHLDYISKKYAEIFFKE